MVPLHSFEPGGVERVAMRLAHSWVAAGHSPHIVLGRDEGPRPHLADGLTFDVLQRSRVISTRAFETLWMIAKLPGRVRAARPDVIFCPGNSYAIVGVALKLMLGRRCPPIVLKVSNDLVRSDMPPLPRLLYRIWCRLQGRLFDRVAALAEPMRAEVQAAMRIKAGRVAVIDNPVLSDPEIAAIRKAREASALAHPGRCFLAIGRLEPQKNFALLIRAFARIAGSDDRLAILGEGSERAALEALVRKLGLTDRVLLPGHVEATADWLGGADAFVLSSNFEGLPAVVLEALAAGLPVVSTNCSVSMPELLEHGRLGRLVPVGDEQGLAAAMAAPVSADPALAAAMVRRFSVEQAAPAYLSFFERAIHASARRKASAAAHPSFDHYLRSSRVSR